MALRSVMHSHPCRNFPPVTVTALDSLPILPDLAIPATSLIFLFDQAVSVRGGDSVIMRDKFIAPVRVLGYSRFCCWFF